MPTAPAKRLNQATKRWEVYTGVDYQTLEQMPVHTREAAANYLSAEDLLMELETTTGKSKRAATLGNYEEARKYAEVADFLEEYIQNGGNKHR